MSKSNITKSAIRYTDNVLSGKILACQFIISACNRFKYDLMRNDLCIREDILYKYERLTDLLVFQSGEKSRERFWISDFQKWIVCNVLGMYYKDGRRKYLTSYIETARKSSKTTFAASIAIFELINGNEGGSEVLMCATSQEQAGIMFKMCRGFSNQIDPKKKYLCPRINDIKFDVDNALLKCLPANSNRLDGYNASFGIIDEYHAHPDSSLYDVIKSSMAMRKSPHLMIITTAGFNIDSACYSMRDSNIRNLSSNEDDRSFCAIYSHDNEDEWIEEKNWIKSNPNLGVTVKLDFLRTERNKAISSPSELVPIKTKSFNTWCSSQNAWIDNIILIKVLKKIDWNKFNGYDCYAGVDLSSTSDLTALSWLIVDKNGKHYYGVKYYLPKETINNSINSNLYRTWVSHNFLTETSGNVVDYDYITNDILKLSEKFRLVKVGYDKYNATQWAIGCTEMNLPIEPFSQTIGNFNQPTKELERCILSENCVIESNPITQWCFNNVNIKNDHNGNIKPIKEYDSSKSKIDGVIAIIQSLGMYLTVPRYSNTI